MRIVNRVKKSGEDHQQGLEIRWGMSKGVQKSGEDHQQGPEMWWGLSAGSRNLGKIVNRVYKSVEDHQQGPEIRWGSSTGSRNQVRINKRVQKLGEVVIVYTSVADRIGSSLYSGAGSVPLWMRIRILVLSTKNGRLCSLKWFKFSSQKQQ